jgi:hypothetical protein
VSDPLAAAFNIRPRKRIISEGVAIHDSKRARLNCPLGPGLDAVFVDKLPDDSDILHDEEVWDKASAEMIQNSRGAIDLA